ncbi:MAG TPA: hypothetical protein VHQ95_11535 [Pyrinomonadaceae bacterium]|nr:hypothetical protein [Pyrinomonadaceae bacterium]
MKVRLVLFILIIISISTVTAISFAQRTRDTADKPITGDFKITIKNTVAGNTSQGTTMIKGSRQREETSMAMGQSQINITQCDLKRTIQINDSARKYLISSFAADEGDTAGAGGGHAQGAAGSAQRGGVVTMTVNTVDTGERKEMFGFTARHLKRTTMMDSGPGACSQNKMKIENDGWYINLEYGLACESASRAPQMGPSSQGCRDRYQYHRTGPATLGFPLSETTTMYGEDGRATFTMMKEVIEISRQSLDAALFEIPAGYTQAASQQEMYGAPSMDQVMAQAQERAGQNSTPSNNPLASGPATANAQARAKVGVVEFNNKAKASVSTDSLRQQLIAVLNGNGIDAVALNASSASEAALEAKAKGCAYILYTDISALKVASTGKKLGGFLGKAAGVGSGDGGKSEAKLDYRLVAVDSTSPKLQSSASAKEETAEASVNAALQDEARAVAAAVGRN